MEVMARTVEIGRAVLSSQASSSQLWLTTSITISSENHSTNLQRLNQAQVLEYLLSGSCWVSRGNGLHLVLELSVQGEPLGIEEKEQLATDIVNAPVWEQLHIRASIPEKGVCAAFQESDEKDIRINIDHCRAEPPPKLQLHRIGRNVPFADVRPPAGIPVINLMSVKLNMAVLMNSTKSNTKKQKVNNEPSRKLTDPPSSTIRTHLDSAATQREHSLKQTRGLSGFRDFGVGELSHNTNTGKDNRTVPRTEEASRILTELLTARGEKRKKPTERPTMKDTGFNSVLQQDIHEFSKYMDSALRISVCKGAVKLPQGVKLLTSTFTGTLSEICPAVWRLQYLQGMSQRAHLLPTISRFFGRVWPRVKSLSLRSKLDCLAVADIDTLYTSFEPEKVDNHAITSAHSALWRLVQQKLTERPIKAYEPFCSLNSAFPTTAGAEDILDQGSAELEEDILDGIVDDGHALIDTAPQELNDAIPHTPTNQEVPLITKSINRHKITSFLPHVKQDGAATPERPTPEPLTPEAPTPMTLALTATSDMLITETRNELFLGPPRMDRELKILRHTNESSVTLGLADVVEDFDSLHTPDTPQSEAYGYLELSGEMEFDGLLQETHSSSKDQMTDTESDAFDHAVIVPEPISVR